MSGQALGRETLVLPTMRVPPFLTTSRFADAGPWSGIPTLCVRGF